MIGTEWDKDGTLMVKAHLVQVLSHCWLRSPRKANATVPLRQLRQMQLATTSSAISSKDRLLALCYVFA